MLGGSEHHAVLDPVEFLIESGGAETEARGSNVIDLMAALKKSIGSGDGARAKPAPKKTAPKTPAKNAPAKAPARKRA